MGLLLLIGFIVIIVCVLITAKNSERLGKNTISAFVGSLGSGKTYLAVSTAIKAYRKNLIKYRISRILFKGRILKKWNFKPSLYSNIPIALAYTGRGKNKSPILSKPLTREHLLMLDRLPEKAITVIDEIGQFASQWEFDNPLIMEQVATFIRFYRHFTDGRLIVTDQVSDNIVKPIRSRLGIIYYLNDFRRWWFIMPFFKVSAIPLLSVEDTTTRVEDTLERYFFGFLPYSRKRKNYETRCYKPLYAEPAIRNIHQFEQSLYCRYLIDMCCSNETKKAYSRNRSDFREWIYNPRTKDYYALIGIDSSESGEKH